MLRSLDSLLARGQNPFTPVQMGGLLLGWTGSPFLEQEGDSFACGHVVIGDEVVLFHYRWLVANSRREGLNVPPPVVTLTHFEADYIFNLPAGSVDVAGDGELVANERTLRTLLAMVSNFVTIFRNEVQSQLNSYELEEAIEAYDTLKKCRFPYWQSMNWRGQDPLGIDGFAQKVPTWRGAVERLFGHL